MIRPTVWLLLVNLAALAGCDHEAAKVKQAYEEVIDHSSEYKRQHTIWKKKKLPGWVWAVRENRDNPSRPALEMDITVPPDMSTEALRVRLQKAARIGKGASSLGLVRVQAWPEGLLFYGGIVGTAHLAQDGRGWDGKGNSFRGVKVITGQKKGVWRPSAFDVETLRAMEKRRRILLADPKHKGRIAYWNRRPAMLDREVVADVASQLGLTSSSVQATLTNARAYWWKPRWQPSSILRGQ